MAKQRAKKTGKPGGFAEKPQAAFEAAPLSGPVSSWIEQLEGVPRALSNDDNVYCSTSSEFTVPASSSSLMIEQSSNAATSGRVG